MANKRTVEQQFADAELGLRFAVKQLDRAVGRREDASKECAYWSAQRDLLHERVGDLQLAKELSATLAEAPLEQRLAKLDLGSEERGCASGGAL